MVIAVIVGIGSNFFSDFINGLQGQEVDLAQAMSLALAALVLGLFGIFAPSIASGLIAGAPQLGAGSVAATAALADGSMTRSTWGEAGVDARRFAAALTRLGMRKGDRIATLAMNHGHHLVSWYGTAGMGGVLHTVNPRLFDEQLVYIINHAADRMLFFDEIGRASCRERVCQN